MRLRNIPGADDVIAKCPFAIKDPQNYKGKWSSQFVKEQPLYIEIGMGKGKFIYTLAKQNPDINYIGIEKYSSVLLRAIQKVELEEQSLPNLLLICMDAEDINECFANNEVDKIYLNFSDPWPKDRHAKRRLPSKEFLKRYEQILKPEGDLEFKTDNRLLFDFAVEEVKIANWSTEAITYDLHNDEVMNQNNVMTEYEEKFSSKGNPIHKIIIHR